MAVTERQKLWFAGLTVAGIAAFVGISLRKISSFVDQFSFTPTVKKVQFVGANLFNFPPVLGNARITADIRIDNPLNGSHAITDFSVRIFDTTVKDTETQIGNSLPYPTKITIPASSSATVTGLQIMIPVQSLLGQVNIAQVKEIIATGKLNLNRTYKVKVHLKLDGIVGDTETSIKI